MTPGYLNSYGQRQRDLRTNPLYDESAWRYASTQGELQQYSYLLEGAKDTVDADKLYNDYNLKFATPENKIAALNNEYFKDTTIEKRTRYKTNEDGVILRDAATGKPIEEEYEISNYDYYKNAIIEANNAEQERYNLELEREAKASMSGFAKFMASIGGIGLDLVSGFVNGVENTAKAAAGLFYAGFRAFSKDEYIHQNFGDAYVQFLNATIGEDTSDKLFGYELTNWLEEFESKYTYLRDIDGTYTNWGKYLGSAATSIGEMLPSMLIPGFGGGKVGKIATEAVKSGFFYAGATARNIKETYQYLSQFEGVTVSSAKIIGNAVIKSTIEYGIERLMGAIFGTSAMDQLIFKRGGAKIATGKLLPNAIGRLFTDVVSEGLEESTQDLSSWLIDKGFQMLIDEDFGLLTKSDGTSAISFQSLMDAFLIGAISSFGTSSVSILSTKRQRTPSVDKDGKVVKDENGNIVYKKLSKLSSWEMGINLQSFMNTYNNIIELGKENNYYSGDSKAAAKYKKEFAKLYGSYRILASIYGEIGTERFETANKLLTAITSYIDQGMFNTKFLTEEADYVCNEISNLTTMYTRDQIKKKLMDAGIAKINKVIDRPTDIETLRQELIADGWQAGTVDNVIKLFEKDGKLKRLVATEHGKKIVPLEEAIVASTGYLTSEGKTTFENICEQNLIDYIVEGHYVGFDLKQILELYKKYSNNKDADINLAVAEMLYNKDFLNELLFQNDAQIYKFVSSLKNIVQSHKNNTDFKMFDRKSIAEYNNKLNTIYNNLVNQMYTYCLVSPNVDIYVDLFSKEQIKNRRTSLKNFNDGIFIFLVGLNKKVLIANQLGELCNIYHNNSWVFRTLS